MGVVVSQCSREEVEKYFRKSGVDISSYTEFFRGTQKKDFVIAAHTERTSGIYINEPDILTEAQENEIYAMTGVHVNTLCASDVAGLRAAQSKIAGNKAMLTVASIIILILLIQVGVKLSGM